MSTIWSKGGLYLSFAFSILFILSSCSGQIPVDPLAIGDPELGYEVFSDRTRTRCEGCHSLDGSTSRGGPSMLGIAELADEWVADLSAAEYLRQSILDPAAYIVEGYEDTSYQMKPYTIAQPEGGGPMAPGTLTGEELDNLIAFLLSQ